MKRRALLSHCDIEMRMDTTLTRRDIRQRQHTERSSGSYGLDDEE